MCARIVSERWKLFERIWTADFYFLASEPKATMRPPPRLATKTRGGNSVKRPASVALRTTSAAVCIEGAGRNASAGAGRNDPAEKEDDMVKWIRRFSTEYLR